MDTLPDPRDEELARLQRRVSELAAANQALEREIAARTTDSSEPVVRALVDGVPGLVAILAPDGGVEAVNRWILEYCGGTLEELKSWGTNGTVHDEDLPHVADVFGRSIASGEPYEIEQRLRRYDGEYRWFRNRGAPVRDVSGGVAFWYVLLIDIDDLKRAEEALKERERNLRSIIDGIPGFIAIAAPDGELIVANRQMTEYFGASLDELKPWGEYVHEDDLPAVFAAFGASIATGAPFDVEHRLRRADGVYRWFGSRGLPNRDSGGNIAHWRFLLTDIDDLKRAEGALAARESELRLIVDSIPGMVTVFAPDGQLEAVNRPVVEYFGKTLDELRRWQMSDAVHPDDRAFVLERFANAIATGTPLVSENRARRFDGEYRWLQTRNFPLKDESGRVVRWYNLLIDVDERKRAEAELQRAYESFADAQRISHTGSFTTDLVADDHNWSDESYRIFDFEPGTTITVQRVREIVHPDDVATYDAMIARGAGGEDVEFDFRIVTARGELKHVHALAHVVERVAGRPMFVGALQDVTKNRLAEEQLRRSQAFLAEGQRLSQTGSFSWRTDTDELLFSDELRRIFEFDPETALSIELIVSRVHPMDAALVQERIAVARSGGENLDYEVRLQMPDGRVKHVHTFAHGVDHDDGRREVVGAMLDVTQRRRSEEALESARSELAHVTRAMSLGVLTASIAHEVNQPLSGILTNASTCLRMLGADPPNVSGALETARRTIRDANRASEVITRLRGLFGKKEPAAETVDLNEVAREVIALSLHELHRRRVALVTELDDGLPPATGDRIQLQQVILNLILNASDAMEGVEGRPRRLLIRTAQDDGAARVTVQDTGVGLPPDSEGKLFEAFYTTKLDGMGIGLSVSRSIIERHNGRLWAERNDGPGATFSFTIPFGPPTDEPARPGEADGGPG